MLKIKLLNFVFLFLCSLSIWRVGFAPSLISLLPFSISWELETTVRLSTQTHTGAQCLQKVRSRVAMHGIHTPRPTPLKKQKKKPPAPLFCHSPDGGTPKSRPWCGILRSSVPSALPEVFAAENGQRFRNFSFALWTTPPATPPSHNLRPTPLPLVSVFVVVVRLSVCYDLYWFY